MKKWMTLMMAVMVIFAVTACSASKDQSEKKEKETLTKLVVGASNVPHAEILKEAQPLLKEKGIELKIVTFQDYILPNKALESKELDANYFQHIPYLKQQMKENKYDFVNAGGIHIEPIGVYSQKYKSLKELPKGATILMSNSVADHGRILSLFENEGLIELKKGIDSTTATVNDIVKNPKKLVFKSDIEPGMLAQAYKNEEGDAVVINTNYALDAGLNPSKDSIALEGSKSQYVNIITVRKGDEKRPEIKTLVDVLHSKTIQNFIEEKYKGAIVPVSE